MPELPEVETVRMGLDAHVVNKNITTVGVRHPRAIRNVEGGEHEVIGRLEGRTIVSTDRRGKFMWLNLDDEQALLMHLGMSGQMLIKNADNSFSEDTPPADDKNVSHLRIFATLSDLTQVWFVDQRTFGYWWPTEMVESPAGSGIFVPEPVAHIALDLIDPRLDLEDLARRIKAKKLAMKTLLLNQEVVAGIGNIYADEMLWQAAIHPRQRADRVKLSRIVDLLLAGQQVMHRALAQGGTSFDELYVNVNGQSGYFDRSLNAYGQQGRPCPRCGTEIVREKLQNRSSHFCPRCQKAH